MKNETTDTGTHFRLYGVATYDRSAKVRWLMSELGIKFETQWIDRETNGFEDPKFLKLNPMGRVPVLEFGDQGIAESGAICSYLADLHLDKGMAPKLDSPERAKYQQWMYFSCATLDAIQTRVMVIEDIPASPVHEEKLKALQSDLNDALTALDEVLMNASYLVANKFGAADICVGYHLYWLTLWPELDLVLKDFPRVIDYVSRLKNNPKATKLEVFNYPS